MNFLSKVKMTVTTYRHSRKTEDMQPQTKVQEKQHFSKEIIICGSDKKNF